MIIQRKKLVSLFVIFCLLSGFPVAYAKKSPKEYTYEELGKMELKADIARNYYWKGEYEQAVKIFGELTSETHPSRILYLLELGNTYLATGDVEGANKAFYEAYKLLETYRDIEREKKAISEFGKEEEKIYRGDPYEQSTGMLLLALIFMDRGDIDNALAAVKTAVLADSDATENLYTSDFTLIHLLEAKIHKMRGEEDEFKKVRDVAAHSYRITHPDVRDIFSERLDRIALLKMPPDERKKLDVEKTDEEIKKEIAELDQKLNAASEKINAESDLGPLYTGDYNTLILLPVERSPYKSRKGKDAQIVFFRDVNMKSQPVRISVDGTPISISPVPNVADITFQAETRGGRRMDAILKGQAAFRSTTVGIGNFLTEMSDDVGGYIGLGMLVVGVIAQGIGGAISPEADTRCWETLPKHYDVYALSLPEGEHSITFDQFLYFEKLNSRTRTVRIEGNDHVSVVFGPPSLMGLYSSHCENGIKLSKRDLRERKKPGDKILITPPLGLHRIERFMGEGDDNEPEACAPDAKKIMRSIKKALKKKNLHPLLVSHDEIIADREKLAEMGKTAVQVRLRGLKKVQGDYKYEYRADFEMSLIDTRTGQKLYSQVVEGSYTSEDSAPTKGFYNCLKASLEHFVSSDKFMQALRMGSSDVTARK